MEQLKFGRVAAGFQSGLDPSATGSHTARAMTAAATAVMCRSRIRIAVTPTAVADHPCRAARHGEGDDGSRPLGRAMPNLNFAKRTLANPENPLMALMWLEEATINKIQLHQNLSFDSGHSPHESEALLSNDFPEPKLRHPASCSIYTQEVQI